MRSGSSAGTSDRILTFSSFTNEARVLLSSPGMPNAAETIPSCESDRFRFLNKRPKKIPLLQLADQESKRLQILKSTGSRKHAVHQPAHDPFPTRCKQRAGFKGHFINSESGMARDAPLFFRLFSTGS